MASDLLEFDPFRLDGSNSTARSYLVDRLIKSKGTGDEVDGDNDEKGQTHLALGSPEYKERMRDLQGIDEITQERYKKSERSGINVDLKKSQKEKQSMVEFVNKVADKAYELSKKRLRTPEAIIVTRLFKMSMDDQLKKRAKFLAEQTPALDDDKLVNKSVKLSRSNIYDSGIVSDDYIEKSLQDLDFEV